MISMNSKSCASWPYLPSFLFCSVFEQRNYTLFTSVSCVEFLLPYVSLQSNWAKTFKTRTVDCVFFVRIFVSAHVIITLITALGMFTNLCWVPLLLFIRLGKWSDIVQFGRWRDLVKSFPPPPQTGPESPWRNSPTTSAEDFYNSSYHNEGLEINLQELRF